MGYVWQRWLADALRAEGCAVREVSGWQNRGRPASSGGFEPYGVLEHHTGTTTSASNPNPTLNMCIHGRPDLPGPLCQVLIGFDGVCHVIAAGRANHAGACNGFGPFYSGDGNIQLFGWEIDYNGTQPIPPLAKEAAIRATAAVLKRQNRSAAYVARHAETSVTGKWDTGGVTGDQWRSWVSDYLEHGSADEGDDDMPKYVAVSSGGIKCDGQWRTVSWEKVTANQGDAVTEGNPGIRMENSKFTIEVGVTADGTADADASVATRLVRGHFEDGEWVQDQTLNPIESAVSGSTTQHGDTRVYRAGDGQVIRVQFRAPAGLTASVYARVLYWQLDRE